MTGSQIVARNAKLGRFAGTCGEFSHTCTVGGLSAGFIYEIWVRTCSKSEATHCMLRAMSAEMVTYPRGMSCSTYRINVFPLNHSNPFHFVCPIEMFYPLKYRRPLKLLTGQPLQ